MEYLAGAFLLFILALFVPFLRKAIGLLFVILGTLGTISFVGLILGIPMILFGGILLFIGNNKQQIIIENKNIFLEVKVNKNAIECPYCYEIINESTRVCRNCRRDLPEKSSNKMGQKYTCINCYKIIPPNLDYCTQCNTKLFSCDNCNSYVDENDTACWFCGIQFKIEEEEEFRGFLKRLLINRNKQ